MIMGCRGSATRSNSSMQVYKPSLGGQFLVLSACGFPLLVGLECAHSSHVWFIGRRLHHADARSRSVVQLISF